MAVKMPSLGEIQAFVSAFMPMLLGKYSMTSYFVVSIRVDVHDALPKPIKDTAAENDRTLKLELPPFVFRGTEGLAEFIHHALGRYTPKTAAALSSIIRQAGPDLGMASAAIRKSFKLQAWLNQQMIGTVVDEKIPLDSNAPQDTSRAPSSNGNHKPSHRQSGPSE